MVFKWSNEETKGEGLIWRKSFVIQEDSQGEDPDARVFLTCLQNR